MLMYEYCLLWIDWWPLCMSKAEWSGWVQAVGAIFAILAAGGIATYQVAHTRRIENEKRTAVEIQRLNIVKALAVRCFALSREVVTAINDPTEENIGVVSPVLMRDVGATLLALPLFEIPGGIAALDVITLGRVIGNLANSWEEMIAKVSELKRPPTVEEKDELRSFATEIADISESAMKHAKEEIRNRRGLLN